jgi:hypothetical protein
MTTLDHDGNTVSTNDKVWIPATVTSIDSNGVMTLSTSYGSHTVVVAGSASHKAGNFPDRP